MFLDMGHFYRSHGYLDCSHNRVRRTEIVLEFAESVDAGHRAAYEEALIFDLYKIEKSKSRPIWARDLALEKRKHPLICEHMDWKKILSSGEI